MVVINMKLNMPLARYPVRLTSAMPPDAHGASEDERDAEMTQKIELAGEAMLTRTTTLSELADKARCLLEMIEECDQDFAGELARSLVEDVLALAAAKSTLADVAKTIDGRKARRCP